MREEYPDTEPFVAPYWIENDLSEGGNISYNNLTGDSELLFQVSNFISRSEDVEFCGTWMLVAHWINIPLYGSDEEDAVSETFGHTIYSILQCWYVMVNVHTGGKMLYVNHWYGMLFVL